MQNNVHNEQYTFIKIEYGDFKDTKYEMNQTMKSDNASNNYSISRSDKKFVSCTNLYNLQHPVNANISLKSNILNVREQNKCSLERVSAFVPVNIPDNDTKIARLRSIGFKPINFSNSIEDSNGQNKKVLKQNVAEKYNKYTNEENDVVVYMDDKLQYQDIEDEDKNSLSIREKISDSKICTERLNKINSEKESCNSLLEQDIESPWHGWKKIVTNKDTYWIGW